MKKNDRNSIPVELRGAANGAATHTLMHLQEISYGSSRPSSSMPEKLTEEDKAYLAELKRLDLYVREHEQVHAHIGAQFAASPEFEYARGPDGHLYAIGGKVSIDVSPIPGDPEATIRKMKQVRAAALAPADPSAQDHVVAIEAQARMAEAMAEIRQRALTEQTEQNDTPEAELTETPQVSESDEGTADPDNTFYDEMDTIFSRVSAQQNGSPTRRLDRDSPARTEQLSPKAGQSIKADV